MAQKNATSTKVYWITWSVLLAFTLVMVWLIVPDAVRIHGMLRQ